MNFKLSCDFELSKMQSRHFKDYKNVSLFWILITSSQQEEKWGKPQEAVLLFDSF